MNRKSYRDAQNVLSRIDPEHHSVAAEAYERMATPATLSWIDSEHGNDALNTAIIEMGLGALTESPAGLVSRARYRAIDERRTRKRTTTETLAPQHTITDEPTPVEELEAREVREFVLAAMDRLDGKHRQILHLYYWQRLSPKQIAANLGVPLQTIYTRLSRAKEFLSNDPTLMQLKD